MAANFTLNMEARLDEIGHIHAAIDMLATAEDWTPDFLFQIKLMFEEIGTNIAQYGYDEDEKTKDIRITLSSRRQSLTMEFIDDGRPFDPFCDAPPPDLDSSLEDRPVGGLGIHLVRNLMDEAHYRREDGRNKVVLIKSWNP